MDDGVRIEALYEPSQGDGGGRDDLAIVVAHGFTGSVDRPAVRRAARVFRRYAAVITFSFRGHGGSGGRSTVGDREVLDVAAAVRWARSLGHEPVVTVGFSMGGSVVVRHAALYRDPEENGAATHGGRTEAHAAQQLPTRADHDSAYADADRVSAHADADGVSALAEADRVSAADADCGSAHADTDRVSAHADADGVSARADADRLSARAEADRVSARADVGRLSARADAVVAVSAPARWYYRGTAPMRRLHWVVTRPAGRLVGRVGLRTRIHARDWDPVPLSPVEAAARLGSTPLLVVHGDRDPYFPLDHPRMLAAAAGHAELWIEPGMGHAENAAEETLLTRIGAWLSAA